MADRPLRVVLVDDDDGLAALLEHSFELDSRFRLVGRARNGREGVEVVEALAPDAVLMDLHMPILGGVPATRALVEANPHACVIVFTGSRDAREHEAARQAGAVAVLPKPFDPAPFLDAVAAHAAACRQEAHAA